MKQLVLLAVLTLAGTAPPPATARLFTPAATADVQAVADPRLSPDGKSVVWVVTAADLKQNRRRSAIWIAAADGSGEPRVLTTSPQSSSAPRWRPDGKALLFLSSRPAAGDVATDTPRTQAWLLPLDGGEPRRITAAKNGVSNCEWAPDALRIACLTRTGPSDEGGAAPSPTRAADTRVYSGIDYKLDGSGWFDDRRAHIWIFTVATGAAKAITSGDQWNDSDLQWSPDGTRIAFVSDRAGLGRDWEGRHNDVWVVSADGGTPLKVSSHDENDASPAWSPDGKTIAYLGSLLEGDHPKIYLVSADGGASRLGSADVDALEANLQWGDHGSALYFEANVRGAMQLFRVDVLTGKVAAVTSGMRQLRSVDINDQSGRMTYRANDARHPDEVFTAGVDGRNEVRLSRVNDAFVGQHDLQPVERFTFKGAGGLEIEGYLVQPIALEQNRKYPLVLAIHGGPNGMFGYEWDPEWQAYAARGYAVVGINPRGSSGYGEKFQRAVQNEWGGKAYVDLMNGVDAVLARNSWIDGTRLAVVGHSYGGFMTNWIVGQTTRFKAAATLAGISDFISIEGLRDAAYNHRRDFGGDIFEVFDPYWTTSPLKYVKNVKTPVLILHGEADQRVPLSQGEEWFRALRHFGVPAELVVFPRASHGFTRGSEPRQVAEILDRELAWFDKYVMNAPTTPSFEAR
jgi:dipeptidyl aminopeptidase/acylaminoacyl peptidase